VGARVAAIEPSSADELRLRSIAALSAPIAGAWLINAIYELARRTPGHRLPFVLLSVCALAGCAALARRARTTPAEMDLRSDWSLFFFFAIVPILALKRVPAVGTASGLGFAALMVAGYVLERRRLRAIPGINLARLRFASPLPLATCEERVRSRVALDDGRFAGALTGKQLLLRFTDDGVALRVRNAWLWSSILYYLRLRPGAGGTESAGGTEIELCPVVSPRAVLVVNAWVLVALSVFLVGVAIVPLHRAGAFAAGFAEVAMMLIYAIVHVATFRRQKTDARIVEALLTRDLEAHALRARASAC
jgi:hypothetical protein